MIRHVVEQHALEASFLWTLRDRAAVAPHYDRSDLGALDQRLEAHLDGLRIAGDLGWEICEEAIGSKGGGEVFAASVLAIEGLDYQKLAGILDAGGGETVCLRAMVAALGWVPRTTAEPVIEPLLEPSCPAALRYLGVAAAAVHGIDLGVQLTYILADPDPRLRARALRAAGELGRAELAPDLRVELGSDNEDVRFWAAWSAAIFGDASAEPVLWAFAEAGGRNAERACVQAVRLAGPARAGDALQRLSRLPGGLRTALQGARSLGDPRMVPWVIEQMEQPELARPAGEAFSWITGADLETAPLAGDCPEGFEPGPTDDPDDDDVTMDPDFALPWPDRGRVAAHWQKSSHEFPAGTRRLLGRPIAEPWLEEVLQRGSQRQRAAAAIELAALAPGRPVASVRAPAHRG